MQKTEESQIEQNNESSSEMQDEVLNVSFGDEEETPPQDDFSGQPAPDWVKELRRKNRELEKELKQVKQTQVTPQSNDDLIAPKKPTLKDCDYDEDLLDQKLEEYVQAKSQYESKKREKEREQEQIQKTWEEKVNTYQEKAKELNVNDYDISEDNVKDSLSDVQQGILLDTLKNPALFVYAIGKNEAKLKEIANIKNPVQFAAEVARLEMTLKSNKTQRQAPPPEKPIRGNGGGLGDTQLEALKNEAYRTGDFTKYINYKKQQGK